VGEISLGSAAVLVQIALVEEVQSIYRIDVFTLAREPGQCDQDKGLDDEQERDHSMES
jgi:hypothetical protein